MKQTRALIPGGFIDKDGPRRDLSTRNFETEYRSLKDDPVGRFYMPCLHQAASYRRAVGYFRSSVFNVIGLPIIEFARRGGHISLICSPDLETGDAESIVEGLRRRSTDLSCSLIKQFDALLADRRTAFAARTLATLVATGSLEIRLAERRDGKGIYHEKIGIFDDDSGNRVSFKGSTNETWSGWHEKGNFESIEVFCDWRGGLEALRVERHSNHFDALWSGNDTDVDVFVVPPDVCAHIKRHAAARFEELTATGETLATERRSALPHQSEAVDGWAAAGFRGVFEHATGSGKTFTATLALRCHLDLGWPAIVLVPSRLLLEQWSGEVAGELPDAAMLLAGGGHDRWRSTRRLRSMTNADPALGPRIVLATMATAASPEFLANIQEGAHLMVVADEVHQIGSPSNSRFLAIDAGKRLGLSATPQRHGDPDGTRKLFAWFGEVILPRVTLADAVAAGRLVPYEYHPHPVQLSATEAEQWRIDTLAIQQEIARQPLDAAGGKPLSDRAKMMLIKRARIAKKAQAKVALAVNVLTEHYDAGQTWLVYCEDGGQLAEVLLALRERGLAPIEYHSSMLGDRITTMEWFKLYGGILVSIRCLDEGVDIPAVSHALILASSQNPRQFIQRRGRVLRRSPGKALAIIHDAIVVPVNPDDEKEQLGLLRAELVRSVGFARNAVNSMAAAELRDIAIRMRIAPDTIDAGADAEEDDE